MTWLTALLRRPSIGWWDLAGILVVSILIYQVLVLIRGTRAVQMVVSGAVLVGLFYGSRWGHLETVNWLIRNMFGTVALPASGLFQPAIPRRPRPSARRPC